MSTDTPPQARNLIATEYLEYDPAISPDGRWLAYVSERTGAAEVWVQAYPEGTAVRISAQGGYEPHWSPEGRELFYLQDTAMMAVPVVTENEFSFGTPAELFRGGFSVFPDRFVGSYDVAQDGRFLMIRPDAASREVSGSASIVVVENWTEELKRLVPTN